MRRPKPKRYPALMKKASDPSQRPGPPVPPIQSPRYSDYDLEKFKRWIEWHVGGTAGLETREEIARLAGFAWIDGQRESTWRHGRQRSDTFPPTESGVRLYASQEMAGEGIRSGDPLVGDPAFLALWWPVSGGAQVVCGEPATGRALTSTLLAAPESGLFARVAGGHRITFTDWRETEWRAR